jgi:hypothetical protein
MAGVMQRLHWKKGTGKGREQRWIRLYGKHEMAWRQWMANKKDGRLDWLMRLDIDG